MRFLALVTFVVFIGASCAHIPPASTDGVPPPWPATDPPIVHKAAPAPPSAAPTANPPVPPQKPGVLPQPTPPQS